jgi:alginate O-acetyltransferase complex protein AlgI
MLFSSPLFVFCFLPVVLGVYFAVRAELRNPWLLAASLFFYAWGEKLLVGVMLLTIVANWAFGLWIEHGRRRGRGRFALGFAVAFDLAILFVFKYADWLWDVIGQGLVSLGLLAEAPAPLLAGLPADSGWRTVLLDDQGRIRLPIGVSFFTFQALSYVIDVFRGEVTAQRSVLTFAVYKSLFPQLIAGPIVRYKDVAAQFAARVITTGSFAEGVRRFVTGLAKKMLVANVCAQACDQVFQIPALELTTPLAWLGIVCYSLQIYFDFSGYSDMAIGLGRMLGFTFLENFDYPYIARSVTGFWRRWHISLSSWFRDYLYIPLGGNRISPARTYANLLMVFVLCGLWHGASVTFLVWGLYHGAFLVLERAFLGRLLERLPALLRHVYLILAVMVGWVFFRATSLAQALDYLGTLCGLRRGDAPAHPWTTYCTPLLLAAIAAGVVGSTPWTRALAAARRRCEATGRTAAAALLDTAGLLATCLLMLLSMLELAGRSYNPFIYFRF